jgi:hypothetical protein
MSAVWEVVSLGFYPSMAGGTALSWSTSTGSGSSTENQREMRRRNGAVRSRRSNTVALRKWPRAGRQPAAWCRPEWQDGRSVPAVASHLRTGPTAVDHDHQRRASGWPGRGAAGAQASWARMVSTGQGHVLPRLVAANRTSEVDVEAGRAAVQRHSMWATTSGPLGGAWGFSTHDHSFAGPTRMPPKLRRDVSRGNVSMVDCTREPLRIVSSGSTVYDTRLRAESRGNAWVSPDSGAL